MNIQNKITQLPWHPRRRWSKRDLAGIQRIIIHQELGEADIKAVNHYHINPNHITPKGCPHFCYHFGIEKNGDILQVNELSDITWHTPGQNEEGIGIMLTGNFAGPGHLIATSKPTPNQIRSLGWLCDYLVHSFILTKRDIFGHCHFGKPACPGTQIQEWIEKRWETPLLEKGIKDVPKTILAIQKRLDLTGYDPGPLDGIMGVRTQAAIRAFQRDHSLLADGIVGPKTWSVLLNDTH
ncbi:MAG: peptidoglycan recognition protein family protein [Bacteroidales bacterium]